VTTWKTIPGFSSYQASDRGKIRSVPRTVGSRRLAGVVLKARLNNSGYELVNLTGDDGIRQTRTVHSLVLEAFAGPCPDGCESLHANDNPTDNRWPENLSWGSKEANMADRMRNSPAAAKPPKPPCVRCGAAFEGNGRRCHPCVVEIGVQAAVLLNQGIPLDKAAEQVGYPSVTGLHTLARKHGGYAQSPPPKLSWSQRVRATGRRWTGQGDAQ
jgi:NUMOD4 motif/HNH endonuclease